MRPNLQRQPIILTVVQLMLAVTTEAAIGVMVDGLVADMLKAIIGLSQLD